ncbi:hypothetical protein BDF20DRAFT_907521 [Mycotypha africana]|uniref:uncharacterized protein n=1 Tax=Mycotypha africana TaxID=64632 RepID=UPI0023003B93|nr:uncharacterized protein BDF20DRAFT_907521 [Mycotypha africana]KAI8969925.1 hypothetical protein BDF20DRAFT_907521 [Mycotypha africana]
MVSRDADKKAGKTSNNQNEELEKQEQRPTQTQPAEEPAKRPQHPQPSFKYTIFPVKGYNILPTRNITSTFAKSEQSYLPGNKSGAEEISPNPEEEWRDTIIIHPGSRNLRIGLASEAFPVSIPHAIARKLKVNSSAVSDTTETDKNDKDTNMSNSSKNIDNSEEKDQHEKEEYEIALQEIRGELKWRMKSAKRRAVPNAEQQVIGFNASAYKEMIPDHNDPYKVEWTDINNAAEDYYVGEKALKVPISQKGSNWRLFYPWKDGTLNNQNYDSVQAVLNDLEAIWTETIVNELEVKRSDFKNCNAVLVIPDLLDHSYICDLTTMMLRYMNFKGVILQQESVCATYGAGISSAVVVDIGAQTTKITCIEEGVCQVNSRIAINMGGDDITETFAYFLMENKFPYAAMNLNTSYDWKLAETLKEKWCTMNEADISVQVYDFFARTPFKPTLKYQCKVYDEVFLAPLCLMYPNVLKKKKKEYAWEQKDVTDEVVEDAPKDDMDNTREYDTYPIDVAIAQSIQSGANGSEEKMKRYFQSIILVGGGGKIVNFSKVLEDRVLSTVTAQRAGITIVEVLPAPRELDPEVLVWKGASVMAKLDSAKDMWIGQKEWDEVGARCLRDRALLMP